MGCPIYSDDEFEQIAGSMGVSASRVYECRHSFESAAAWYRSDLRAESRVAPSKRRTRMIAAAARKLLQHLKTGKDYAEDGPEDWPLLQALSYAGGSSEDEVIRATGRVGDLAQILEAVEATQLLQHCAERASEDSEFLPKGRRGELAENDWIAAMMDVCTENLMRIA
jgi:hypothetical protein